MSSQNVSVPAAAPLVATASFEPVSQVQAMQAIVKARNVQIAQLQQQLMSSQNVSVPAAAPLVAMASFEPVSEPTTPTPSTPPPPTETGETEALNVAPPNQMRRVSSLDLDIIHLVHGIYVEFDSDLARG